MANLPESSTWETGIYQIELTDPVEGGVNGIDNRAAKQLANRTKYLKDHVDAIEALNLSTRVTDLETDSTINSGAITNLENMVGAASGVRHGIIAAKHGTGSNTEKPTFLDTSTIGSTSGSVVIEASSTVPFICSVCEGYVASGPVVKYGMATVNTTLAYSQSTDMILLASVSNGIIQFTLDNYYPFFFSYAEPASPSNGSYWFNMAEEKTYKRETGAWVNRNRLPIAIISPGASSITYFKTIRIGAKDLYGVNHVPSGTIHTFAGTAANVPAGYLLCDGGTISRTTYSRLFQAIGTTYGVGDGSTTFAIPDLRGEFIRGLDNSRGVDTDTVTTQGSITNGSASVTAITTVGLSVGMAVSGTGIAGGTTILSINSRTSLTLSANATATNTLASLTFSRTRTLGSAQADNLKQHEHYYAIQANIVNGASPTTGTLIDWDGATAAQRYLGNTEYVGGAETRPRNVAMNFIIKF